MTKYKIEHSCRYTFFLSGVGCFKCAQVSYDPHEWTSDCSSALDYELVLEIEKVFFNQSVNYFMRSHEIIDKWDKNPCISVLIQALCGYFDPCTEMHLLKSVAFARAPSCDAWDSGSNGPNFYPDKCKQFDVLVDKDQTAGKNLQDALLWIISSA